MFHFFEAKHVAEARYFQIHGTGSPRSISSLSSDLLVNSNDRWMIVRSDRYKYFSKVGDPLSISFPKSRDSFDSLYSKHKDYLGSLSLLESPTDSLYKSVKLRIAALWNAPHNLPLDLPYVNVPFPHSKNILQRTGEGKFKIFDRFGKYIIITAAERKTDNGIEVEMEVEVGKNKSTMKNELIIKSDLSKVESEVKVEKEKNKNKVVIELMEKKKSGQDGK
jgi:hypothetical protein